MTINDIARMMANTDRYKCQSAEPKLPNGSLPPKGHVNPYCPEGMDITGMKESDFKFIPVSKEAEQQMRDIAFNHMKDYYGMSGGHGDVAEAVKAYLLKIPVGDRINAGWTLNHIHHAEATRLYDFVKSRVPGWEVGKPFDTSILDEYQQGVDMKA